MKSPFRALRRKLFNEGKLLNYTGYAVGEVLLIIIGILIALKIADWNDYRQERKEEAEYLQLILEDLEQSLDDQINAIGNFEEKVTSLQESVTLLYEKKLSRENFDQFHYFRSFGLLKVPLTTDSLDELMNSGKFTLISNRELRRKLSKYRLGIGDNLTRLQNLQRNLDNNSWDLSKLVSLAPIPPEGSLEIVTSIDELNSNADIYNLFNQRVRIRRKTLQIWKETHDRTKVMRDTLQEYIEKQ